MKKLMLLAAGLLLSIAFAGCAIPTNTSATAPVLTAAQKAERAAQKLQTDVTFACNVLQPAIAPYAVLLAGNPAIDTFNADVVLACGTNALLNLSSINSLIDSSAAAAQTVVGKLPNMTADKAALIGSFIGAFQGSLKNAITAYNAATAAAVPASGASAVTIPAAASAPVAASQ